jgi:threonine dehydrogenase-like Zn-dependent dehydrogenase
MAKLAGATRIICVGAPAGRLEVARAFGADAVVDIEAVPDPEERRRAVLDETPYGIGADIVYGCVGVASAWLEGVSFVRDEGCFMELGLAADAGNVAFNPAIHLVSRNLTFMGTLGLSDYQDAVVAGRILEQAPLPFGDIVSPQLPLERVGDAIQALNSNYRIDGQTALKIAIAPNGPVA